MIFFIPAAVFALMGWLIRNRKSTWLHTGYRRPSKELKEEGDILRRAQAMGNVMFFLAAVFLLMAVVNAAAFSFADRVTLLGLGVVSLTILIGVLALSIGEGPEKDRK